jgi:NTP pyrophosphatase (non-canonical NTP hydrolase)
MNFDQYMKFVNTGVDLSAYGDTHRERLVLAGMGLGGEAGEVCDHAKKVAFHGMKMDRVALVKEMGDVLWYFTLLASLYDITLTEVMEKNVFKLCERHSNRYGEPYKWLGAVRPEEPQIEESNTRKG